MTADERRLLLLAGNVAKAMCAAMRSKDNGNVNEYHDEIANLITRIMNTQSMGKPHD